MQITKTQKVVSYNVEFSADELKFLADIVGGTNPYTRKEAYRSSNERCNEAVFDDLNKTAGEWFLAKIDEVLE